MQYRHLHKGINTSDDLTTSCKNCPVRLKVLQRVPVYAENLLIRVVMDLQYNTLYSRSTANQMSDFEHYGTLRLAILLKHLKVINWKTDKFTFKVTSCGQFKQVNWDIWISEKEGWWAPFLKYLMLHLFIKSIFLKRLLSVCGTAIGLCCRS